MTSLFKKVNSKMSKRSDIWNHFDDIGGDDKARCKFCRAEIGYRGGSTSALWKHLESKHTHAVQPRLQSASQSSTSGASSSSSMTITGMFSKTNITTARSERITGLVANMIAKDTLPLSFVEGTGFKELMAYVEPGYVVPCAKTIKKRLQSVYEEAKKKIRAILAQTRTVALTTDCWTSGATESFICLSAHYVCPSSFTMMSWILATCVFNGRHTGLNIKDKLDELLQEWGIDSRVSVMVHDNAANMNLASELSDKWERFGCSAHTLQLAVNHAFEKSKVTDVITSASRLVSHFRHSSNSTAQLKTQQMKMSLPIKKLMLHSKTRWNSAFDMLQRLLENRWAVSAVLADPRSTKPQVAKSLELSNDEWHVIESICPILDPVKLTTVMLSAEENVSISIVLPAVAGLLERMAIEDDDPDIVQLFKEEMQQQLTARFQMDALNEHGLTTLHKATFLDPRFTHMTFVSKGTKVLIIRALQKELTPFSSTSTSSSPDAPPSSGDSKY